LCGETLVIRIVVDLTNLNCRRKKSYRVVRTTQIHLTNVLTSFKLLDDDVIEERDMKIEKQ